MSIGAATGAFTLDPAWVGRLADHAVTAPSADRVTIVGPLTGRPLAEVPLSTGEDVALAVTGARAAFRSWSRILPGTRAQVLRRFHDLLLEHQVEVLDLIQLESGVTRSQAFAQLVDVALTALHAARRGPVVQRPRRRPGVAPVLTHVVELHRPVGVVGVLADAGGPAAAPLADIIPALATGNAVVVRPAPDTPLTMLALADLFDRAGLPQRALQVVLGEESEIGGAILDRVEHVCFWGSTEAGAQIAATLAPRFVGTSLTLDAKNSLYVAADADLDRAVPGAVAACFTDVAPPLAVERLFLHESVADDFLTRFVRAVARLRVGTRLTYGAQVGVLPDRERFDHVVAHVEDARSRGADVLAGGRPLPQVAPHAYAPTVLDGVTPGMRCAVEPTRGPVVGVRRVGSDAEFVLAANESPFGLRASVWSRDAGRARGIAQILEAGSVTVDDGGLAGSTARDAASAVLKASGTGARRGDDDLRRFTTPQSIAVARRVSMTTPATEEAARYASSGLRLLGRLR